MTLSIPKGVFRLAKRSKKRAAAPTKAQRRARNQVFAICLFVIGVFFFLLAVIEGEALWKSLHNVLLGLLGWSAFFIGPLLIYVSVMASFEKYADNLRVRALLTFLLLCVLCATWQIFLAGEPLGHVVKTLWEDGKALHGGGVFSILFGVPLMKLGTPGDKIAVVLMLLFLLMVITNSTIAGVLRGMKKPIDKAVEVSHGISDSFAARQEERAAQKRTQIDIPLGDPPRRRKREPKDDGTAKEKLLTAAGIEADPAAGAQAPAQPDISEPLVPDAPIDEDRQIRIDDIIDRISQKEQSAAEAAKAAAEKPAEPAPAAEELPKPEYVMPPLTLLNEPKRGARDGSPEELRQNAQLLVDTLQSFGVQTRITDIARGPAVTRYELQPAAGVKISRITSLADDIALNLAAAGVRIEAPIPGKAAVGIEVPNKKTAAVTLREVLSSPAFEGAKSRIAVALGRDISGNAVVADIAKMPHLLIAGATGSGKSVCINSIIMSILFHAKPEEVKLLLVDPKVVELGVYNGLPHLAVPVVSDPKKAAGALGWAVTEMLNRYRLFAAVGARDLASYNKIVAAQAESAANRSEGEAQEPVPAPLPQYVIVVDELADLMMAAPSEVEDAICRLAQMARAAGMHLIIATQRPSTDVITGVIKANIPSRIAFAVSSQVDSRVILDMGGAEKLLGMGDMLFNPVGAPKPTRVQGCFVSDEEIERTVSFIKSAGETVYDEALIAEIESHIPAGKGSAGGASGAPAAEDEVDPMLEDAIECVVEAGLASTSLLQRKCKLGYARAARLIDELEARGIVGPFEGSKPRTVLISKERWLEMKLHRADEVSGEPIPEQTTL